MPFAAWGFSIVAPNLSVVALNGVRGLKSFVILGVLVAGIFDSSLRCAAFGMTEEGAGARNDRGRGVRDVGRYRGKSYFAFRCLGFLIVAPNLSVVALNGVRGLKSFVILGVLVAGIFDSSLRCAVFGMTEEGAGVRNDKGMLSEWQ